MPVVSKVAGVSTLLSVGRSTITVYVAPASSGAAELVAFAPGVWMPYSCACARGTRTNNATNARRPTTNRRRSGPIRPLLTRQDDHQRADHSNSHAVPPRRSVRRSELPQDPQADGPALRHQRACTCISHSVPDI